MRYAWTAAALLVALVLHSALGILAPSEVRIVDPFMVVVVYCGLTGGETHGMLAGAAAGWIQDIHFGGPIVGLSALAKLVIGFGVGVAGNRFMIVGTPPRSLTLFVAVIVEALLLHQLALLTLFALIARATITALLGALVFETIDLRLKRSTLRP
jgi:cell shape-determining protein MreD